MSDDGGGGFAPSFDEGWLCVSAITFFLLIALVGQRASDDALYAVDPVFGRVLRRPRGVPRSLRPAVFGCVAVLLAAGFFSVYREGGWADNTPALALAITAACVDALAVWVFSHLVWLRVGVALRFATLGLTIAAMAVFSEAATAAGWLAAPAFVWSLYTLCDAGLVLFYNRRTTESELEVALEEAASASVGLDPPAPEKASRD